MWTTLVTVIRKADREYEAFLSDRKKEGIRIVEIEPEQIYGLLQDKCLRRPFLKEESLLLTDVPKVAVEAKRAGIALLGLERKGGLPMPYVPYVLQGLEGTGKKYLQMVYQRFHHEPLVIAETERLHIRELIREEAGAFLELCREAGLQPAAVPEENSREEQKKFLEAYIRYQYGLYGYGMFALLEKETGEWIGTAGVEDREYKGENYLELGYAIIPEKRRQGYAREACLAVMQYLKEELELEGIIKCFVPRENTASQRTAQSIGLLQTKDIFDKFYCYERML